MVNTALRPAQRIGAAQAPPPSTAAGTVRRPFTAAEEEKLRQLYPTALWSEILEALPGRTQQSVRDWASYRGVSRATTHQRWSPEEDAILHQRYRADGPQALAERFGRTAQSIKTRASVIGVDLIRPAKRTAQRQVPDAATLAQPMAKGEALPATPVLNARAQAKAKKDAQPSAIAKMLEQMRQLPAGHPRRLAYMLAARNGNGQDAYQAWLNWKPQQAA